MWRILLLSIFSQNIYASYNLDKVIISSKSQANSKHLTSSHFVLDEKDLSKSHNLIDALEKVSSIKVNRSGGPGSFSSLHIRGSEGRHVLILVDGVRITDPSSTDRISDISFINLEDVEKIEVIKGSQSHLYGADAIGGVINIITRKNNNKNSKKISINLGATNQISGYLSKKTGKMSTIFFNAFFEESEVISAAKNGKEIDGFNNKGATFNWSKGIGSSWLSTTTIKFLNTNLETDGGAFIDDNSASQLKEQRLYLWKMEFDKDELSFENIFSLNQHSRVSKSLFGRYEFLGDQLSQQSSVLITKDKFKILIGSRIDREEMSSNDFQKTSVETFGLFGQYIYETSGYFSDFAVRADIHEEFGSVLNYTIGSGYDFSNDQVLKLQISTGFKAPSLYQLYSKDISGAVTCKVGNENLLPEKSKSLNISWSNRFLELGVFSNEVVNFIDYQCADGYSNISTFKSNGIELIGKYELLKNTNIQYSMLIANYKRDSRKEVARRPNYESKIDIHYIHSDAFQFNVNFQGYSKRYDYIGEKEYLLDSYLLTNLQASYKKDMNLWQIELNNIFDQDYVEVIGYSTLGINAQLKFTRHF